MSTTLKATPPTLNDLESVGVTPITRGRYPKNLDLVTHGWRWYRIIENRLISPIFGRVKLPCDGVLDDVYFVPRADDMFWLAAMMGAQGWYDFALTFGAVAGPFLYDHTMPRVGSLKAKQYTAIGIFTTSDASADIARAYDLPVIGDLRRSTLLAAENAVSASRESAKNHG
ncbi:hypothetical protein [Mycobacterium intracellulare]|uniref:hypothetical protein n=1 Tax=Mycobacterium intracellulare TaxID=1767 RepID=UPI001915AD07|nr:hypothetical protein [Mycobacterium intracellulare]